LLFIDIYISRVEVGGWGLIIYEIALSPTSKPGDKIKKKTKIREK